MQRLSLRYCQEMQNRSEPRTSMPKQDTVQGATQNCMYLTLPHLMDDLYLLNELHYATCSSVAETYVCVYKTIDHTNTQFSMAHLCARALMQVSLWLAMQ